MFQQSVFPSRSESKHQARYATFPSWHYTVFLLFFFLILNQEEALFIILVFFLLLPNSDCFQTVLLSQPACCLFSCFGGISFLRKVPWVVPFPSLTYQSLYSWHLYYGLLFQDPKQEKEWSGIFPKHPGAIVMDAKISSSFCAKSMFSKVKRITTSPNCLSILKLLGQRLWSLQSWNYYCPRRKTVQSPVRPVCRVANRLGLVGRTECPMTKRRGPEVATSNQRSCHSVSPCCGTKVKEHEGAEGRDATFQEMMLNSSEYLALKNISPANGWKLFFKYYFEKLFFFS